jgi:hypothetical protein
VYGIDDSIVDAKRIVGDWFARVLFATLATAACDQRINLGEVGDGPASLLWKATFEPGNLSEWTGDGHGGTYVENDLDAPAVSSAQAHRGSMAGIAGVTPMGSMVSIDYFFRDQPTPTEAYYSAWFFVPSTLTLNTGQYLSLVHFRGSDGQELTALWDVNLTPLADGSVAAQMYQYSGGVDTQQFPVTKFPLDRWVQLEVLLTQGLNMTGHVAVWQDGTLILDRPNVTTVVLVGSVQWDVGGASAGLASGPTVVYVDDAAISLVRLGPDTLL